VGGYIGAQPRPIGSFTWGLINYLTAGYVKPVVVEKNPLKHLLRVTIRWL
jgi:hypothetical protein